MYYPSTSEDLVLWAEQNDLQTEKVKMKVIIFSTGRQLQDKDKFMTIRKE
jgi:hypothetical protein